jgi:hypothetical protein
MILLGDLRSEIAKEIQRGILKVIDTHKEKENYFILVWAGMDIETGIVKTKLILLDKKPAKMLGTLLYYVDNQIGKLDRIWALPLDHDVVIEPSEEIVEEVVRSSKDIPIYRA